MNWKNLANYDYLGAYSVDAEPNKEVVLTIKEIKRDMVTAEGGKSEMCILARFVENKVGTVVVKPMVLNKTNCKTLEKLFESGEIENWIGKKITIYATTTKFGRDPNVPCLRIKNELPAEPIKQVYACSVCGKEIDENTYNGSVAKYGVALCSKECLERYTQENNNKEENK